MQSTDCRPPVDWDKANRPDAARLAIYSPPLDAALTEATWPGLSGPPMPATFIRAVLNLAGHPLRSSGCGGGYCAW